MFASDQFKVFLFRTDLLAAALYRHFSSAVGISQRSSCWRRLIMIQFMLSVGCQPCRAKGASLMAPSLVSDRGKHLALRHPKQSSPQTASQCRLWASQSCWKPITLAPHQHLNYNINSLIRWPQVGERHYKNPLWDYYWRYICSNYQTNSADEWGGKAFNKRHKNPASSADSRRIWCCRKTGKSFCLNFGLKLWIKTSDIRGWSHRAAVITASLHWAVRQLTCSYVDGYDLSLCGSEVTQGRHMLVLIFTETGRM